MEEEEEEKEEKEEVESEVEGGSDEVERPTKKGKGKTKKAVLKLSKKSSALAPEPDSGIQDALEKFRWYSHDGSRVSVRSFCSRFFLVVHFQHQPVAASW